MKLSATGGRPLFAAYSLARRSGFLDIPLGRWCFKSAYFFYKRYLEDDLRDLLKAIPALVRNGDALDIGANLGYTATVLAKAIEPGQKVYAFEPEVFNYGILQQTALNPEFENKIIALQVAVGAQNGSVDLWMNQRHHADHRIITEQFRSEHPNLKGANVRLVSVDSFLESKPGNVSFVKIDVQGYEFAVCQGMRDTLQRNPNISVLLEFMPSAMRELGFEPSHLIDFFVERDFRVYLVDPQGKLTQWSPSFKSDAEYFDLLFSRRPMACENKS